MTSPESRQTISASSRSVLTPEAHLPRSVLLVLTGVVIPCLLAYALITNDAFLVCAAVLATLGLMVVLARPFWGLIFLVALIYIRPEDSLPALGTMRVTLAISVATLVAMWFQLFLNRERATRVPITPMILGFGLMVVVSTVAGGDPVTAAMDVGKLVVLVLLVLHLVRTPERYRIFATALLIFTVYVASYSIYRYFSGDALIVDGGLARAQGTGVFGDPNDLAAVIVAGLALAFSGIVRTRAAARVPYILAACWMIWAIMLTNSRGGLLALLVLIGGFFVTYQRRKAVAIMQAVLVSAVVFMLASGRMTNFDSKEKSANGRFWFWNNGIIQLVSHPATGVGYQQLPNYNEGKAGHNSFVICFAETGLPGYFFWMGCLYYAFRGFRRRALSDGDIEKYAGQELRGARLALLAYLTAIFWINHTYYPVLYILISLPIAHQVAFHQQEAPSEYTGEDRFRDCVWIGGICIASLGVIWGMIRIFG